MMQEKLIENVYQMLPANTTLIPLMNLVKQLKEGYLQVPEFQREFVWKKQKITEWINSIINQYQEGGITTYQIIGGSPIYLSDGFQRITATIRFLEKPSYYGFDLSRTEAVRYVENYSISRYHQHHEDHFGAMRSFQRLNAGTPPVTGEVFKGEISLTEKGKIVYENIPQILDNFELKLAGKSRSHAIKDKLRRDSFACFYQYDSKSKIKTYWDVDKKSTYNVQIIERILAEYIKDFPIQELNGKISRFRNFISDHFGDMTHSLEKTGMKNRRLSNSASRWFIHFHIWCNNNGIRYRAYKKLVILIFKIFNEQKTTANIKYIINDGEIKSYSFRLGKLGFVESLAMDFGVEEIYDKKKRTKNFEVQPGFHEHHIKPFSKNGNGDTVAIPALLNMSIGNDEKDPLIELIE